ncbi:hypothetical protein HPB51_028751 [Rhipicephalus microplus]|uniref:Uncharacterized protein n=1 Tax=Rhipicephalus microplus TaxID=6941 RepID=A0A9J6CW52_RHIMP|nr:hypothetical protein HPB51_028751 [Rhipicephalus microplus]
MPRRAANGRTSATASGNRGRRNGRLPPPPHGAILPNERGILPPSHLLPSKPGNITVYCVAVAEQCAGPAGSGGGAQHQSMFAVKTPGEGLPHLVNAAAPQLPTKHLPHPPNAVPLQSSDAVRLQPSSAKPRCPAVPEQCACSAGSGGDAQHQFDFSVQPPGEGLPQQVNAAVPQPPTIALPRPPNTVPLQPSSAKPQYPAVSKPKATDFVFVLKSQTQLFLADAFPENGAGRTLIARLGPHIADKLIGEFVVPSPAGLNPLFGYWHADNQDSCYGVVTIISNTEDALRESLYWHEGGILHVPRLGISNNVRLTSSGKVKPKYVAYDALFNPVQPYKKKLFQPVVSVTPLYIDPTPVPASNQTFVASAKKPCRSRKAPILLMSVRPSALSVLGPTSSGTGAVKNATGHCNSCHPLLHR